MLGRQESGQGQFFYSFDLDKVVPPDHLVRQIDGLLDLSWVHNELAPFYSHTGGLRLIGADDPDADRRLRICASFGTAALR